MTRGMSSGPAATTSPASLGINSGAHNEFDGFRISDCLLFCFWFVYDWKAADIISAISIHEGIDIAWKMLKSYQLYQSMMGLILHERYLNYISQYQAYLRQYQYNWMHKMDWYGIDRWWYNIIFIQTLYQSPYYYIKYIISISIKLYQAWMIDISLYYISLLYWYVDDWYNENISIIYQSGGSLMG